jgi:succinyl-CoA synthetase beta subunit
LGVCPCANLSEPPQQKMPAPEIDVLLIDFVGSEIDSCQQVMQYLPNSQNFTTIWRVLERDRDRLAGLLPLSIKLVTNFDRAIAQTLAIAKQRD